MPKVVRTAYETQRDGHRKLYKFRGFENPEWIKSIFEKQELHLSSPTKFNDPFECKPWIRPPRLLNESDRRDSRKQAFNLLRRQGMARDEAKVRAKRAGSAAFMEQMAAKLTESLALEAQHFRIICLAGNCKELLLWSHYADSHKGFCLGFDASHDDEFGGALQVLYSDTLPTVDFFDRDPTTALTSMVLTKAKSWAYENEYRLVAPKEFIPGYFRREGDQFKFPPDRLVEVIFGCQIDSKNEELLRDLISAYPHRIRIRRAVRSLNSFALSILDV